MTLAVDGSESGRLPRRRSVRAARSRLGTVVAVSSLVLATSAAAVAAGGGASHATPEPTCTFNGHAGIALDQGAIPTLSNVLSGVSGGTQVAINCVNLDTSALVTIGAESSPLAGIISPSSDEEDEADANLGSPGGAVELSLSGSTGTAAFTVGSTENGSSTPFSTSDPNAMCPPTQAQINVGLGACILAVAAVESVGPPLVTVEVSAIVLEFGSNVPKPANPTLAFGSSAVQAGGSVSVSDAAGASGYWWGAFPGTAGTIPASQILIDGIPASSSSVTVSPASYNCMQGGTDECSGGTGGTLVPQALSGHFTVPSSVPPGIQTVKMFEADSVPVVGNSTDPSFPNYLEATATIDVTKLPPCSFKLNGTTYTAAHGVTGAAPGSSVSLANCNGLAAGDDYTLTEASPLATVISPASAASQVEDTADAQSFAGSAADSQSLTLASASTVGSDPNATCPPTQAEIDAGLVDCTLNLVDTTSHTDYSGVPLQFTGEGSPGAPSLALSPTSAHAGTSVSVSDTTGTTHSWWGNAAVTTAIPSADILVAGVHPSSSTVEVKAATYTASGGTGTLTPPELTGSFVVPPGASGGSQKVTIFEPNDTTATGNSTSSSYPGFVAGSASISIGTSGYWLVGADGGIFSYGGTQFYGSCPQIAGGCPGRVVGVAATADGAGYWLTDTHGDVYTFGDAAYDGSLPGDGIALGDIVGITATPDGKGYWLLGADGGVFTFGDAGFFGSCPQIDMGCPGQAVALLPTADGGGYRIVDSHGDVYAFGDAAYEGSMPGIGAPVDDVVSAAATPDGHGYWMATADGGVYTFGDAQFGGSCGTLQGGSCGAPLTGIAATSDGGGYYLSDGNGDVYTFGNAQFEGSTGGIPLAAPVAGIEPG